MGEGWVGRELTGRAAWSLRALSAKMRICQGVQPVRERVAGIWNFNLPP